MLIPQHLTGTRHGGRAEDGVGGVLRAGKGFGRGWQDRWCGGGRSMTCVGIGRFGRLMVSVRIVLRGHGLASMWVVRRGRGVIGVSTGRVRHLVTCVRILGLRRLMTGVRIGLAVLRMGIGRLGTLIGAMLVLLGRSWVGGNAGEQEKGEAGHAFSPSSGRTVTTRIMPACMW